MAHYYAVYNPYGNRTLPYGNVYVFDSRRERDEWVAADRFDGDWHREDIGSRKARRLMVDYLSNSSRSTDFGRMGTDELVEAYCSCRRQ